MLRTLFSTTILAGALAGTAMAQAPDAGCALPSESKGIPAAIDAAITGPADKDRACMKGLFISGADLPEDQSQNFNDGRTIRRDGSSGHAKNAPASSAWRSVDTGSHFATYDDQPTYFKAFFPF